MTVDINKPPQAPSETPWFPPSDPIPLEDQVKDPWVHRREGMRCRTCMWYVEKQVDEGGQGLLGRCRCHAPVMGGFPVVFPFDWCGDHRLDEGKV